MEYKVWNKKDDIKGFSADYWINELGISENDGVFLILNNGVVERVEIDTIIKCNYNLDPSLATEEVAKEYIRMQDEKKDVIKENQITLEDQAKKIDILNAQNANLLLDNAKKEIEINTLNTNLANVTLEVAKIKGGM